MKIANSKQGIVVIGGHVQGLGIIRIFGKKGMPIVLIDNTSINIARFSKYCLKFYKYPKSNLLDFLVDDDFKCKYSGWLLIPTNDLHVKVLSQNKKTLSSYYKVSTDEWESISLCYNKVNTYKLASSIGITIPKTYFPTSLSDIDNINISYPCIIKPAVMHEFYDKIKKKVFVCKDYYELKKYYCKAVEIISPEEIIIQEIVKGSSENQYSACFLFIDRNVISYLTARRKRQHPIDFGNATTFAELVDIPEIVEYSKQILKQINYNGLCEVEFKWDESDGKFKFLEINPRTWKWHLISEMAGINFLINLHHYYYDLPFIPDVSKIDTTVCWKHFITDLPTVIKLYLKGQFIRSKAKSIQHATWDKQDILPSFFEIIFLPFLIFKR